MGGGRLMKNALILHGTYGSSQSNWLPWLRSELEKLEWKTWVPDLPRADKPSTKRYNKFLLKNNQWDFNNDSIIVGHSSGAVAILGLLQALPEDVLVDSCYLIGSFSHVLTEDPDWEMLKGMFEEPFDFRYIKMRAKKFIFIHSNDDPYCPLEQAKYLANKLDGELIVKKGQKHFNISTYGEKYRKFPFLLETIERQKF